MNRSQYGETVPVINQWYGYFRINISDTGNDFSSIIRELINMVQRYSTFREIETHGAGQVQMAVFLQRKIKFALYNHISRATLNIPPLKNLTSVGFGTAHSLKHHCTANIEVCDRTQNIEQVFGNRKQALGRYISMRHFMNANLNQIHCKVFT